MDRAIHCLLPCVFSAGLSMFQRPVFQGPVFQGLGEGAEVMRAVCRLSARFLWVIALAAAAVFPSALVAQGSSGAEAGGRPARADHSACR
jgi:hypothetical protein